MTTIARVHGRQSTDEESFNVPAFSYLAAFTFSFTGTSAASAAVTHASVITDEVLVRLCADQDCWIAFGASPTAVASSGLFLPAGCVEVWRMNAGDKVAAIQVSSGGNLSVALLK